MRRCTPRPSPRPRRNLPGPRPLALGPIAEASGGPSAPAVVVGRGSTPREAGATPVRGDSPAVGMPPGRNPAPAVGVEAAPLPRGDPLPGGCRHRVAQLPRRGRLPTGDRLPPQRRLPPGSQHRRPRQPGLPRDLRPRRVRQPARPHPGVAVRAIPPLGTEGPRSRPRIRSHPPDRGAGEARSQEEPSLTTPLPGTYPCRPRSGSLRFGMTATPSRRLGKPRRAPQLARPLPVRPLLPGRALPLLQALQVPRCRLPRNDSGVPLPLVCQKGRPKLRYPALQAPRRNPPR